MIGINPILLQALLETGDRLLVEDAGANDKFWGNGKTGSITDAYGENKLGKILTTVRFIFRKALRESNTLQNITVTFKNGNTLTEQDLDLAEYGFNVSNFQRVAPRNIRF